MPSRETLALHGLAPDREPGDAPLEAWTAANNMLFVKGETVRAAGDLPVFGGLTPGARTIQFTEISGTPYWVTAGDDGIFVTDGATETEITPFGWPAGAAGAIWTSCVLGGLVVINVSDRAPVWWSGDPAVKAANLPGWGPGDRCIAMRAHKNFLFAVGVVSQDASVVKWSDAAEPGAIPSQWDPQPDNLAGSVVLMPGVDPCLDAASLRDSLVVYKGETLWSLDFVADPNTVFAARKMFDRAGIGATNAVAGNARRHVFLDATGDVMETDGADVRSILAGWSQRAFYDEVASFPQGGCCAALLQREQMVLIGYPTEAAAAAGPWADRAVVYDIETGDVGFRDLPDVLALGAGRYVAAPVSDAWDEAAGDWQGDTASWNAVFSGASKDDIVLSAPGGFGLLAAGDERLDGGPLQAFAQKQGLSFGDAAVVKFCPRVWPRVTGVEGDLITVRVGGADTSGGAVDWSDPQDWAIGSGDPVDVDVAGRFLALEVTAGVGSVWRLASVDFELEALGRW